MCLIHTEAFINKIASSYIRIYIQPYTYVATLQSNTYKDMHYNSLLTFHGAASAISYSMSHEAEMTNIALSKASRLSTKCFILRIT